MNRDINKAAEKRLFGLVTFGTTKLHIFAGGLILQEFRAYIEMSCQIEFPWNRCSLHLCRLIRPSLKGISSLKRSRIGSTWRG